MTQVIITSPVWSLNGVNVFSADLARGLLDGGYDARILLTGVTYRERKPMPLPENVPVEQLSIPRVATWGARRRALTDYLEKHAPCVYLPNHDFNHSCISQSLSSGIGVIGIVHSDDQQHYDHFTRLGKSWNAAVAVSSSIFDRLIASHIAPRDRIYSIPYGVPNSPARSRRNDSALRIIYTGRLEETQKRVSELLRVARRLTANGVAFEMTIAGDGPERGRLAASVDAAGLASKVRMTGTLTRARALELCSEHDVFLLPSMYEGMPLSLLEAMGQGCVPVVRATSSGIPQVVQHRVNGLIAQGEDGFADAIKELSVDRPALARMSNAASETIARGPFTLRAMIDAYSELIDRVSTDARTRTFNRGSASNPCPALSLRDVVAAPLWSMRPSLVAQQRIPN